MRFCSSGSKIRSKSLELVWEVDGNQLVGECFVSRSLPAALLQQIFDRELIVGFLADLP